MNLKKKVVIKILLIVAKMFADDPELKKEINALAIHISVWVREEKEKDGN